MIKKFKIIYYLIMFLLIMIVMSLNFYPEKVSHLIGYRLYTVLTDSMNPIIPTFSVVICKIIPKDVEIEPNEIITFNAEHFGEEIILTHYFRKIQMKNGITYYRTQPADEERPFDNYETTREDIIGTYMFHIPYLGKMFLFLKSPFGYVMYAEMFVVFLVNQFVKAKWKEKNAKVAADAGVELANGDYEEGFVEGDIEVLIDINDFNNSDKALLEMEEFNKKQISEWR